MAIAATDPKKVLTIKRTFNAPRAKVFEAWINREQFVRWWGPKGMKAIECRTRRARRWRLAGSDAARFRRGYLPSRRTLRADQTR